MKKTIAWILALCLLAMGIPAMAASSARIALTGSTPKSVAFMKPEKPAGKP